MPRAARPSSSRSRKPSGRRIAAARAVVIGCSVWAEPEWSPVGGCRVTALALLGALGPRCGDDPKRAVSDAGPQPNARDLLAVPISRVDDGMDPVDLGGGQRPAAESLSAPLRCDALLTSRRGRERTTSMDKNGVDYGDGI
jgi:hypothetical protein